MPAGLKRYYGKGHLRFITFSCYRRLPQLKTVRARDIFVQELGKVRDETGFRLLGYVVMPEHVHLLMSEPKRGMPSMVWQRLNCVWREGWASEGDRVRGTDRIPEALSPLK